VHFSTRRVHRGTTHQLDAGAAAGCPAGAAAAEPAADPNNIPRSKSIELDMSSNSF
jgi:hypothetical protein